MPVDAEPLADGVNDAPVDPRQSTPATPSPPFSGAPADAPDAADPSDAADPTGVDTPRPGHGNGARRPGATQRSGERARPGQADKREKPYKLPRKHPVLHVLVLVSIVLAAVANIGVYWTKWRLENEFSKIRKVPIEAGVFDLPGTPVTAAATAAAAATPVTAAGAAVTTAVPATVPAPVVPAFGTEAAYNILMVGVDERSDQLCTGEDLNTGAFGCGEVGGSRTDTIMLLRIDPKTRQAAIMSIPRDTYVTIAGSGSKSRINAAYVKSPSTLVRTVQEVFNVPVRHLVEVDFVGFANLVEAIDGVELCFDFQTRDLLSGLDQSPGCHLVDAEQAVAYVRSRHYEQERQTDVWTAEPGADLGRIRRQQLFLTAAMKRAGAQAGNPLEFTRLLGAARTAISIDSGFSLEEFSDLANQFRSFDPSTLEFATLPTRFANIGGQEVLTIVDGEAARIVGRFGRRV